MKPMNRCRWLARIQFSAGVAVLLGFGGSGRGGEASEPVLWDAPAPPPADPAAAPAPAGPEAKVPKRDPAAARAQAAEWEQALAQEKKRRGKAEDELVSVWKQMNASREETAQLRRKLADSEKAAARIRELEKQLKNTTGEWTERGRQLEAVRESQARLQRQVADLQKRLASVDAVAEKARQAQAEVDRLQRALAEAQRQAQAAGQAGERALSEHVQLQRQAEIRAKALEQARAKNAARAQELEQALAAEQARGAAALEQQKAELAKALQAKEAQGRKDLSALRGSLAEKETALAQAKQPVDRLNAELAAAQKQLQAKSAAEARAKSLAQESAKNAARAQELEQALAELRESVAGKDRELARSKEQARLLQASVAALNAKMQVEGEATAAAQKKQREELADLRHQAKCLATDVAALRKEKESQARQLETKAQQHAQLIAKFQKLEQAQAVRTDELDEVRAQLKQAAEDQRRLRAQWQEEEWVRQGKALREQLGPADNAALVGSLNDVGLVLQAEGQLDEAEAMFRRALVVLDRTSGRSGATAGTILQHLAEVAWAQNDLAAAASYFEEAAQRFSAALGDTHPRHAAALNGWARVRRDQQRPDEAEELYRMAILIYERHAARHPADLVVPLHNLALLLMEQGRLDEAGTLLERAAALAESSDLKKGDALVVMRTMVRYCQAAGDLERAAKFEERANELAMDVWM
ncbi:MAG: tetratricopeptide repeat protein [Kiritimatiellia bacterium]